MLRGAGRAPFSATRRFRNLSLLGIMTLRSNLAHWVGCIPRKGMKHICFLLRKKYGLWRNNADHIAAVRARRQPESQRIKSKLSKSELDLMNDLVVKAQAFDRLSAEITSLEIYRTAFKKVVALLPRMCSRDQRTVSLAFEGLGSSLEWVRPASQKGQDDERLGGLYSPRHSMPTSLAVQLLAERGLVRINPPRGNWGEQTVSFQGWVFNPQSGISQGWVQGPNLPNDYHTLSLLRDLEGQQPYRAARSYEVAIAEMQKHQSGAVNREVRGKTTRRGKTS